MLTEQEFKQNILDEVEKCPKEWRKGQAVFNIIDEKYRVARKVQFEDKVDCFFNDSKVDEFIDLAYKQYKRCNKEYQLQKTIEYFNNLQPFTDEDRIPSIPVVEAKVYNEVIIPNLIRCGAIPKKDLIVGKTYIGHCRNASEAVWNGTRFTYQRYKFGSTFPEDINHFEDDNGSDLFIPIKEKSV